ncbi:MAG: dual specificity protein phosphatase family protein [Patescibacteria group bacterium]|nr:dual specificity protein phosphatase family protein [Patescibacteria group bacterium]
MIEIAPRIFIAKEKEIANLTPAEYSLVSLASTYHYQMHGKKKGEFAKDDPCYIMCSHGNQILSLNWVDGAKHLYDWEGKGVENMKKILTWIEYQLDHNRKVIIMCNQGLSRSPTIALLYMAKVLKSLNNNSFASAAKDFKELYPEYAPGGIGDFVNEHWSQF